MTMMDKKWLFVVAAAASVVLAVAARTITGDDVPEFPTPTAAAEALAAAGVECRDANFFENDDEGVDAVGGCSSGTGDYFIYVFDDPDRAEHQVGWDFEPLRDQESSTPDYFVVGPNWIVTTHTAETADRVQAAIGGEVYR